MPPISYDSLSGDLEGAFSNHNNDDNKSQNRIIACHGVGSDLRMYVQQSDFTIHSTSEHLDKILMSEECSDYFFKIRLRHHEKKQICISIPKIEMNQYSFKHFYFVFEF